MFVAVRPPPEAVDDLDAFLAVRREAGDFRWTVAEQWHLTLAFLADVPERKVDDLEARLQRAARKRRALPVRFAGGGAFPHPGRAKVLYAGLAMSAPDQVELDRLATGAKAAGNKAGAPADGQRFRPHLTLARLGYPRDVSNWVRLLDSYAGPSWLVDEIALVASYLGEGPRRRPRHQVVSTFALGAA
ncbi:MAG TPA: RNA 2',3'-cyclic phosphodiesterase [Marmoricola sp.]|jgi:2'-5' RNA ligase|nr:RNA 2',3'-cyclic phosphodiesterase [Marmoricola sp.]